MIFHFFLLFTRPVPPSLPVSITFSPPPASAGSLDFFPHSFCCCLSLSSNAIPTLFSPLSLIRAYEKKSSLSGAFRLHVRCLSFASSNTRRLVCLHWSTCLFLMPQLSFSRSPSPASSSYPTWLPPPDRGDSARF